MLPPSGLKPRKRGLDRPWSSEMMIAVCGYSVVTALGCVVFALYTRRDILGLVLGLYGGLAVLAVSGYLYCAGVDVSDPGHTPRMPCLRAQTQETVRYCRTCAKSIPGLDHHCAWLNTCVARRTYPVFYMLSCAGTAQFGWHVIAGVLTCTPVWGRDDRGVGGIIFTAIVSALGFAGIFAFGSLWIFHSYLLAWVHLGTYDWLLARMAAQEAREAEEDRRVQQALDGNRQAVGQSTGQMDYGYGLAAAQVQPPPVPVGTAGFIPVHEPAPSASTISTPPQVGASVGQTGRAGLASSPQVALPLGHGSPASQLSSPPTSTAFMPTAHVPTVVGAAGVGAAGVVTAAGRGQAGSAPAGTADGRLPATGTAAAPAQAARARQSEGGKEDEGHEDDAAASGARLRGPHDGPSGTGPSGVSTEDATIALDDRTGLEPVRASYDRAVARQASLRDDSSRRGEAEGPADGTSGVGTRRVPQREAKEADEDEAEANGQE